ncbi:MAG: amino acid permease [Planctomycetes bacterium]|nr:amino acid permease [Planctomycetota bacterium]MCB9886416.1 amino acid permease [Planctomycetota bacterium]
MPTEAQPKTRFGTFGGVFTPCTLTILGAIMFLRFGFVVGQAGIVHALIIVVASKLITTLTSLSLSAIATNTRVRGGGAYYLISRSLGVDFGGAIGIVFYLAQAISVAMYVIGFTEAFVATFPSLQQDFTAIATIVNVATFLCVYIGAGWTIKVQYFILLIMGAALASFYVGAIGSFDTQALQDNLQSHYLPGESIFTMGALFFPAVTGIMAGANMSGDLENPSRSIPRGTLAAVAVTALVYLSQAALLGSARPHTELVDDTFVIKSISAWPTWIVAGVFAATLSSALGSMMGAPRILQAFARDEVFGWMKFLGVGSGKGLEPRRATTVTFVIAQVCIVLGDLNAIAPIITMFFMITYGLLNLATFYESATKNPSYRPTFRYCHWSLSFAGAVGCFAVMFLLNWLWAAISLVLIGGLIWYIRFHEIESRWGDLQSGVAFERARKSLLRLEQEAYHPKNWRPVILALSGTAWNRPHLAICGHWLTAGNGILSLAHVVAGDVGEYAERRDKFERTMRSFIARQELLAFPSVVISADLASGIEALVQCHGIGGLRPNTVLVGWPNDAERAAAFGSHLRLVARLQRSIIAVRFLDYRDEEPAAEDGSDPWDVPSGTIDVWWRGKQNGGLMLLLAHLLHQNPEWRRNRIRMLRVLGSEGAQDEVLAHLDEVCAAARITAETKVLVGDRPAELIQRTSAAAAIVILGFEPPEQGNDDEFFARMEAFAGDLPRVLFVDSAGGMELES